MWRSSVRAIVAPPSLSLSRRNFLHSRDILLTLINEHWSFFIKQSAQCRGKHLRLCAALLDEAVNYLVVSRQVFLLESGLDLCKQLVGSPCCEILTRRHLKKRNLRPNSALDRTEQPTFTR
jgi:hypothetical protein